MSVCKLQKEQSNLKARCSYDKGEQADAKIGVIF